jgi:general stress protein 13
MTNFEKDEIVTGVVTGIKPYGIFLSINDEYNGLIHISEMSNEFVKNVADYAYVGETIRSKVLSVDHKSHQVKLSIKDIDYKKDSDDKIIETVHGFETLKNKLPEWISIKIKEIDNLK